MRHSGNKTDVNKAELMSSGSMPAARYFKARVQEAVRAASRPVSWLVLARLRTRMEEQFVDAGVLDAIGHDHLYPTVHAVVGACADQTDD